MAGLSLLEAEEAASPGPGKEECRTTVTPLQKGAGFLSGGAISEGEEEDDDEVGKQIFFFPTISDSRKNSSP